MFSDDSKVEDVSKQLGIPTDLIKEAEGFAPINTEPYPDNVLAVTVFKLLSTQWRVGSKGTDGLVYEAIPAVLWMEQIKCRDRRDLFHCLRIMERAALNIFRGN